MSAITVLNKVGIERYKEENEPDVKLLPKGEIGDARFDAAKLINLVNEEGHDERF